jgi:hypothetical protein
MGDVPYQQDALVKQLKAERENASALGLPDRVAAVDKQLAELGVRAAGEKRKAASASVEKGSDKRSLPVGRSAAPKSKDTAEGKAEGKAE